ncbi:MAG TPA: ROK family protein [Acidisarcina sp.]|nr:ROK family protein [Acidisarcina sp.]
MKALSLDMGGTHIGCALVEDRRLLGSFTIPAQRAQSLASMLPRITDTLHSLLRANTTRPEDCAGIAIGYPGIVDTRTGKIFSTLEKYEDAPNLDLEGWSRDTFGLPLRLENDARMALLGEHYAGAAQDSEEIVMMTLGTGIGGSAMMHGKLLRGAHHQAGCVGGHIPVSYKGRRCACGNIGCAEAEASGWSLPLVARDWPGYASSVLSRAPVIDFRTLFSDEVRDDAVVQEIRQHCIDVWSANVVAGIHAYDPEIVVIGGGVMKSAHLILPAIQQHVNQHAWTPWGHPQIRAAALTECAGFLGSIPLLSEEFVAA